MTNFPQLKEVPTMTTLQRIEQSQGKLLAAQNELQGDIRELHNMIFAISGKLDGILTVDLHTWDGLCNEIAGLRARLCPVCAKLPDDINPTLTRLSINICQHLLGMKFTDKHVDWIENQIDRFLNYAMQPPRKGKPCRRKK